MADEIDVLREFRADIPSPEAARLDRIADTIAARTRAGTSAPSLAPASDRDIPVLPLDADHHDPEVRGGERGRRAVAGMVAAAAALVVGAIALSLVNHSDSPIASSGEALAPLIADRPPEGFHLAEIERFTTTVEPIASSYVPAGQEDPLTGPLILISGIGPEWQDNEPIDPDDPFLEEVIEVDGHTVAVDRFDEMVRARWLGDDTRHFLLARGITDDDLRAAIGGTRLDDDERNVIDADALPDGWVEFDPPSPPGARHPDSSGSLFYIDWGDTDPSEIRTLTVHWGPGDATDLEWQRLRVDEDTIGCTGAEESEACPHVAGSPVVLGASTTTPLNDPPIVMAWIQDGRFVQVTSVGVSVGELYVFAESLRSTTWEALEEAVDEPDQSRANGG